MQAVSCLKVESTHDGVDRKLASVVLLTSWAGFLAETVREVAPLSPSGHTRGMFLAFSFGAHRIDSTLSAVVRNEGEGPSQRFLPTSTS